MILSERVRFHYIKDMNEITSIIQSLTIKLSSLDSKIRGLISDVKNDLDTFKI